ncbi:DNA-J protein [Trypanosoma cruzi cruzi]|nr:DNA-J protein [Trypanosoma cruzi cruzi]
MGHCGIRMHYRTLGVNRRATQEEIRKAFRSAAVRVHPDKPDGSVELFQSLQTAYEVLSNEKKRALYDAELAKKMSKLRGFKRPPPLDNIRLPVHYKLADDEYYAFETAPDCLKCSFKHGDIISWNNKLGCFIGLAGDNFLYWRQDDQTHASKLCQMGSFGMGGIKVVVRANFMLARGRFTSSSLPSRSADTANSGTDRKLAGKQHDDTGKSVPVTHGEAMKKGRPGRLSDAERLRRDIMRRERERYYWESMAALAEKEEKQRVRLIEKIEADMEDERQSFRNWLEAGGVAVGGEEPAWVRHARRHAFGK